MELCANASKGAPSVIRNIPVNQQKSYRFDSADKATINEINDEFIAARSIAGSDVSEKCNHGVGLDLDG
jgi:hypothetical protein